MARAHAAASSIAASLQPCDANPIPSTALALALRDLTRSANIPSISATNAALPSIFPLDICATYDRLRLFATLFA